MAEPTHEKLKPRLAELERKTGRAGQSGTAALACQPEPRFCERCLSGSETGHFFSGTMFDWAIGWLAREDKIVITPKKSSFTIRLR